MKIFAGVLVGTMVFGTTAKAQGLPFHTETALTTAFEQRGLRMFGTLGRRGDIETFLSPVVILPFAPHQRITTRVVLPLVYKRSRFDSGTPYSQAGIGDVSVAAKWAFFVENRRTGTTRMAVVGSVGLPTGPTEGTFDNGTVAPRSFQLGRGVFGGGVTLVSTVVRGPWGVNIDVGHEGSANADGFRFGSRTRYDLSVGLRIPRYVETIRTRTFQIYLEWNGSVATRNRQNGLPVQNSGGHQAYVSPGLQWVVLPQLLFEGSVQVPVVQDYNGVQPDADVRVAIGTRFLFF